MSATVSFKQTVPLSRPPDLFCHDLLWIPACKLLLHVFDCTALRPQRGIGMVSMGQNHVERFAGCDGICHNVAIFADPIHPQRIYQCHVSGGEDGLGLNLKRVLSLPYIERGFR